VITVEEIWARGLPPATTLAAGESGLGRTVSWVTALRARLPGFVGLKGGELALLSIRGLRELDGRLSLPQVLERLAEAGVAAAAVQGEIEPGALVVADRCGLPLLALPSEVELSEVEQQVARLLAEQRVDLHRRGDELSSQLNALVIDGRGPEELVDRLTILAARPFSLDEAQTGRLHLAAPRGQSLDRARLSQALEAGRGEALAWANRQSCSPSDPPVARFDLPGTGFARLVAPLALPDGLVGLLSVLAPPSDLGELERLALVRGAAACALALSRERAVLATEDRLQREVVDELLAEGGFDPSALLGRASRLGYDLETPHLALLVSLSAPDQRRNGHDYGAGLRRAADLLARTTDRSTAAPLRLNGSLLTALVPLPPDVDERSARSTGRRLHQALSTQLKPLVVSVGLGGPRAGVAGLRAAHREAERALTLGSQLFGLGHLTHFGDLGLYRLLYRLHETPEAEVFCQEVLGALETYDRQHGADLVLTLDAYFAAGASPKETAARLHLHRNTVLYRLQRIADISGHRLDDPPTCLSLQLALRLRQTLRAAQPGPDAERAPRPAGRPPRRGAVLEATPAEAAPPPSQRQAGGAD
jgi:purine catabolism regulator